MTINNRLAKLERARMAPAGASHNPYMTMPKAELLQAIQNALDTAPMDEQTRALFQKVLNNNEHKKQTCPT